MLAITYIKNNCVAKAFIFNLILYKFKAKKTS